MSLENVGSGEKDGQNRRRIHLREIYGDSESPLETVGQDLRAARLRRGDEIAQVSCALKIRKDHLKALEEDRLEDLPGKTYAIGFVRSYARHLGLDSAQYVERFKQDISGRPEEQSREPAPIHQEEGRRLPQGWRAIAVVVALLLIFGIWHLLSSGGDDNQPVPPAPVLAQPQAAAPAPPAPVVIPAQTATPSPATDNATIANPGQAATATPPPAAGPATPATAGTTGPNQGAVPAVPPGNGSQVYGAQNRGARVVLRALNDTRITVRAEDGTLYLNRDLKAGDTYQLPNTPGLSMATNDGASVEVVLDGLALGRAGQTQQVLGRVSLDPQSLVDRFNSR
jgi:cytoskeleton protein RodZ